MIKKNPLFTNQTILISMAVFALLQMSACGKSKETKTLSAPNPPSTTTTAPVPTTDTEQPTGTTTTAMPAGQGSGGNTTMNGAPAPTLPPGTQATGTQAQPGTQTPGAAPAGQPPQSPLQSDDVTIVEGSVGENNSDQTLAPLPAAPTGRPGSYNGANSTEEDYTNNSSVLRPPLEESVSNSAIGLKFDEAEAVKTGGKQDNLFFTSAGRDGLMEEFRSYNKKVAVEQQKMNQSLASAVVSAKIRRSSGSGEIFVDLIMNEFGKMQSYKLKGTDDGSKMNLSLVSGSGDLEFQGGFLKCTDKDNGCENAYTKMKFSGAYSRVIFRNSYADSNYLIYQNRSQSSPSGFNLWNNYVINKTSGAATSQKMDYIQVSSFEVVNGRAGMGAMILTKDQDMVSLSIPLVAGASGAKVSAEVLKISDLSKNYNLSALAGQYSERLVQALNTVKLVGNNGKGQLRLEMNFSGDSTASKMWLDLSRVQKSTMTVDDVRGFEAKVKNF